MMKKLNGIKLNVGASPIWEMKGWYKLDHKAMKKNETTIYGDAASIPLEDSSCKVIFSSHMIEHIPNVKLEDIFLEFNRVLEKGGVLRILSPNLKRLAKAYVENDHEFFKEVLKEDESIRTDLGMGGMFMNFAVSPGQDTVLFNRDLTEFITGIAHQYLYDFEMLEMILSRCGFHGIEEKNFCESEIEDFKEPLHVLGKEPVWKPFNQEFYRQNGLVHKYDEKSGKYDINFKVTGFDRDPVTSLILEAKKNVSIDKNYFKSVSENHKNYNRYGNSLLKDSRFNRKRKIISLISSVLDEEFKD